MASAATPPVVVVPGAPSVRGGNTVQFSVDLTGVNGAVAWSVNGTAGGSAALGTVSATGLYTSPLSNPAVSPLKVRATVSGSNPAAFGEAALTWLNPAPSISSFTPSAVNAGMFTVTITGTGYEPASVIHFNGAALATTYISHTQLSFQTTVSAPATVPIFVSNPDPGGAISSTHNFVVMPPVALTVTPASATVRAGTQKKFSASVQNAVDKTVTWSVNGVNGGNATVGTIAADGNYTAPAFPPPANNIVTIAAVSNQDHKTTDTTPVTLLNPTPVIASLVPAKLTLGAQTITVNGTGFAAGSQLYMGKTALVTTFVSDKKLTAPATIEPVLGGLLTFTVSNPDPGAQTSAIAIAPVGPANPKLTYLQAARFLEQASWGPTPASIAHLQEIGFDAWLTEQFNAPPSAYPGTNDASNSLVKMQSQFFTNAMTGPDQLRQRVAFALAQIFVVSGLKTGQPRQMVPYQNMLSADAFSPYSKVLRDVTLSPVMGVYLDMVNNDKGDAGKGTAPNENYGREVMQLFTFGTAMLNNDGSTQKDGFGAPLPTYDAPTISAMARALTGWTYPGPAITHGHNPENYNGPMIPVDANHDTGAKTIFNNTFLPPGQSALQDLNAVLTALENHPSVAPFICLRLIEHLVESNPSAAYMTRMTTVFHNTHGDLGAVVKAILLDAEARQGDTPGGAAQPNGGHLREPILFLTSLLRNINATVTQTNPVEALGANMGQTIFYPASVFNYYSPLFRLGTGLQAPEFQLLSSATALVRANVVQDLVARNLGGNAHFSLDALTALAGSPADLVDAVNNAFLFGRLPASLKGNIVAAISATTDHNTRVRNAIYLVCSSALYQVEH